MDFNKPVQPRYDPPTTVQRIKQALGNSHAREGIERSDYDYVAAVSVIKAGLANPSIGVVLPELHENESVRAHLETTIRTLKRVHDSIPTE